MTTATTGYTALMRPHKALTENLAALKFNEVDKPHGDDDLLMKKVAETLPDIEEEEAKGIYPNATVEFTVLLRSTQSTTKDTVMSSDMVKTEMMERWQQTLASTKVPQMDV
jgi:iron-sulfur cluster repair protein YtfE (RIC family)